MCICVRVRVHVCVYLVLESKALPTLKLKAVNNMPLKGLPKTFVRLHALRLSKHF